MPNRTRNTLKDLNDYLFQALEDLSDPEASGKSLEDTVSRAKAICAVGSVIVRNADVILSAAEMQSRQHQRGSEGLQEGAMRLPRLLTGNPEDQDYIEDREEER